MRRSRLLRSRRTRPRTTDRGSTLVEVLVAVVLLGGVVAGTLATLRTTILSGTIHRDHSNAHAWLQSASDVLYGATKVSCNNVDADNGEAAVRMAYEGIVDSVANPQDWSDWQIRVVPPVLFWNSGQLDADPDDEFFFGPDCDPSLTLQLIKLEVKSPSGRIIENVEIIK